MADITASMVKDLRERTGAGMMDCKAALVENAGDIEASIDWLRKKGLAKAAKKAGRTASEGLIGIASNDKRGALVEVNSETDFVARNDKFQALVSSVAEAALGTDGSVEAVAAAQLGGKSVADTITEAVATIGENMNLRRSASVCVEEGVVATYVHSAVTDGLGKIGVVVAVSSAGDKDKLTAFGRQVAMHIAAANPLALTDAEVDADVIARERTIFADQARQSGKPENIIEKMVEGRVRKFLEEVVLLKQAFVINPEVTVEGAAAALAKDLGTPVAITGFAALKLGDGVEKEEGDFAAEVAAAAGKA